jgi:predicted dehydrogenase
MKPTTRRTFLRHASGSLAGTLALSKASSWAAVTGANERIVVAVVGCGGQGGALGRCFAAQSDARVAYACDVDKRRAESSRAAFKAEQAVADLRKVLDDKQVDAVVIATPDHWHAPATILACAAGKHVYVEKSCCHNIREGRLMVEAARHHKRIVQVGTQSRSDPTVRKAMALLRDGAIGDVLAAKAWNSQRRANIGRLKPTRPPAGLDWDLFVGPAEWLPYQSNRCFGHWRWWFNFGTGDAGNDGIHDLDIACWGLGVDSHPSAATGYGKKIFFDDDQEFPDTQYVTFEYPGQGISGKPKVLVYEQRIWSPYVQEGHENGDAYYGTKGMMILGKGSGWELYGERNKLMAREKGRLGLEPHVRNFLESIKSGQRPHADIEILHRSNSLTHLANIVSRVGRPVRFDPQAEQIIGDEEANALVRRKYREKHWAAPRGV